MIEKENVPSVQEEKKVQTLRETATALVVVTAEDAERAKGFILNIRDLKKEISEHHRPIIEAAHKTHKAAVAGEKRLTDPLNEAEDIVKSKIGAFQNEERIKAEQARAAAEAEARRAHERTVAAAQANVTKILNGIGKDTDAIGALEARLSDDECGQVEAEAIRAQITVLQMKIEGRSNAANATAANVVSAPAYVPPPAPPSSPAVAGLSSRKNCTVTVVNMVQLCRAIADGQIGPNAVKADEKVLKALASSGMNLPGCHIGTTSSVVIRGR